jgi:hypothetical protein
MSSAPRPNPAGDGKKLQNLVAGLLVPAVGTVVFNVLSHYLETRSQELPPLKVYDIAIGCAFTMAGIIIVTKDQAKYQKFFNIFVLLLLLLIVTNVIIFNVAPSFRVPSLVFGDVLSLLVVGWTILKSDGG